MLQSSIYDLFIGFKDNFCLILIQNCNCYKNFWTLFYPPQNSESKKKISILPREILWTYILYGVCVWGGCPVA